jgi:hypothetical protein
VATGKELIGYARTELDESICDPLVIGLVSPDRLCQSFLE